MIKLYIDIDGVLLYKGTKADSVEEFIEYATNNFDCYWLTTHCKDNVSSVHQYLKPFFDEKSFEKLKKIKPTKWEVLKTEVFEFTDDFIWLDDFPFAKEKEILKEHNAIDRLIIVNLHHKNELQIIVKQLKSLLKNREVLSN